MCQHSTPPLGMDRRRDPRVEGTEFLGQNSPDGDLCHYALIANHGLIPKCNTPNAYCASQPASPCDRTSSLPTLLFSSSHPPLCTGGQSGPSLTPPLACDLFSVSDPSCPCCSSPLNLSSNLSSLTVCFVSIGLMDLVNGAEGVPLAIDPLPAGQKAQHGSKLVGHKGCPYAARALPHP